MAKPRSTHKSLKPSPEDLVMATFDEDEDEDGGFTEVLTSLLPRTRRHPGVTLDELLDRWPGNGAPKPTRDL